VKGFLYYLPGVQSPVSIEAARKACNYAFADCETVVSRGVMRGPWDGPVGSIVGRPGLEDVGLYDNRQTWFRTAGDSGICVGIENGVELGPDDLARPRQLDGHWVRLGDDGHEWLIPTARRFSKDVEGVTWYCGLPCRSVYQADGSWSPTEPVKRYEGFWRTALDFWEAFTKGEEKGTRREFHFDFDRMHQAAVEALQINYAVGPAEVSHLGLLTFSSCQEIMEAVIDLPTLNEYLKKKRSPRDS